MDNLSSVSREEEAIDLSQLVLMLWRGKWVLLTFFAVFVAGAAILSWWVFPREYQASAEVVVQFPRVPSAISTYVPAPYSIPDLRNLVDMLQGDSVLEEMVAGEELSVAILRGRVRVETVGRQGVRLTVRDTDPQRAARLVNRWAGLVEEKAREMYDLEGMEKQWDALEDQAWQEYTALSQQILSHWTEEEFLSSLTWSRLREDYLCVLKRQKRLALAQNEIRLIQNQLQSLDEKQPVPEAVLPRLWSLVTTDWGSLDCDSVRPVGGAVVSIAPPSNLTVGEALSRLAETENSIAAEQKHLDTLRTQKEKQVYELGMQRTESSATLQALETKRSNVWSTYMHLKDQAAWFRLMQQEGSMVRMVEKAEPPSAPVSPRPLLNLVLGALVGLTLGAAVVLLKDWEKGVPFSAKEGRDD